MPKIVNFDEFLKTWNLWSNSVTRQVRFNRTKIGKKCQNSNATFWAIFKQYAVGCEWTQRWKKLCIVVKLRITLCRSKRCQFPSFWKAFIPDPNVCHQLSDRRRFFCYDNRCNCCEKLEMLHSFQGLDFQKS